MAKIFSCGVTCSGKNVSVNEDAFTINEKIYPEMLSGEETQTAQSNQYLQMYTVAEGFGGSGAGDIASRLFSRTCVSFFSSIDDYRKDRFDFKAFCMSLLQQAHELIKSQVSMKFDHKVGVSCAIAIVDANTLYLASVGNASIHLLKNHSIFRFDKRHAIKDIPDQYLGNLDSEKIKRPEIMKFCDLNAADVIVLSTTGYNSNYRSNEIESDLHASGSFEENVKQSFNNSSHSDASENRTVLALKVQDLSFANPADYNLKEANNMNIADSRLNNAADQALKKPKKSRIFLKSMLLGFFAGLAVLLLIWLLIL